MEISCLWTGLFFCQGSVALKKLADVLQQFLYGAEGKKYEMQNDANHGVATPPEEMGNS